MAIFWIITTAMAVIVTATLILAMKHGRDQDKENQSTEDYDLQVYRQQLREIERDLARGVIGEEDAERVRVEVSRRILAADTRAQNDVVREDRPKLMSGTLTFVTIAAVLFGSFVLYIGSYRVLTGLGVPVQTVEGWRNALTGSMKVGGQRYSFTPVFHGLGNPGYRDLGLNLRIEQATEIYDTRPGQEEAEAQTPPAPPLDLDERYIAVIEQLRTKVAGQPNDLEGQVLLALHEANSGNFIAARVAQAKVIELMGDQAGAEEYAQLGELLILATNGYVSPEAEDALRKALERDPGHGPSRYYWGQMLAQTGRPDLAFRIWQSTLQRGPPDAPWLEPIRILIEDMAWLAGVNFTLPTAPMNRSLAAPLAGPSAADMEMAAEMTPEEQQAMIRGMVNRLAGRLAEQGGSPGEWAQLITALGTLGEKDRAQAIYDEAKTVFSGNGVALGEVRVAARNAGLDQ